MPNDQRGERCVEHDAQIREHERRIGVLEKVVFGNGTPGLKGMVNEMWRYFLRAENTRAVALMNVGMGVLNLVGLAMLAVILHRLGIGGTP